jgi:hypothetical protein
MIKHIGTLEGCSIISTTNNAEGVLRVEFTAKMAVCCDGMPVNTYDDKYWQKGTAYYNNGKYLNADKVPYIVVPPLIIENVDPIVLGCMGLAINLTKGYVASAIVGEVGPGSKIGEGSCELCRRIGLDPNPNHGGTLAHIIHYILWPGIPAVIDGVTYQLQPS